MRENQNSLKKAFVDYCSINEQWNAETKSILCALKGGDGTENKIKWNEIK